MLDNASALPPALLPLPLSIASDVPPYRKRGRPKGVKSKIVEDELPRRGVGRPLGSGPKQRERVLLGDQGIVKERKPVGRPRKHIRAEIPFSAISLSNGRVVSFFIHVCVRGLRSSTACSRSTLSFTY
jgi:hypothetical protein